MDDLEHRRPVWRALSTLYLDIELDESELGAVSGELAASPYDIATLERILWKEVHPVLWPNLASVAGEWTGFDQEWLEQRIVARRFFRWPSLLTPRAAVREPWREVVKMLRASQSPSK